MKLIKNDYIATMRIAKKQHLCEWCDYTIYPKETYAHICHCIDSTAITYAMHYSCMYLFENETESLPIKDKHCSYCYCLQNDPCETCIEKSWNNDAEDREYERRKDETL
jgi:hypothetical protein